MRSSINLLLGIASLYTSVAGIEVRELHRFPSPAQFVENIAVRPNGRLLVNTFDDAHMYEIDPKAKNPGARLVFKGPGITALEGLTTISPDVYAVSGGIINTTALTFADGSVKVMTLDFQNCAKNGAPKVKEVARIAGSGFINSLISLPKFPHILLSAESTNGRVLRINTRTGRVDTVFQDDRLKPGPSPKLVPLGINGIKIRGSYLYLTTSETHFYARIKIIDEEATRFGKLEILIRFPDATRVLDDFIFAKDGTAYIAYPPNDVIKVEPNGKYALLGLAQSSVKLDDPTSVALSKDEKTLYVTTRGANGQGGQVAAVYL